jgi:hypothetical protein
MWSFEVYRIMAAQRIAEALLEAEQARLVGGAGDRGHPKEAAPVHPRRRMAKVFLLALAMRWGAGWWKPDAER